MSKSQLCNRFSLWWLQASIFLVFSLFSACHDPLSDTSDQPIVQYSVIVSDSASGLALDSVRIELVTVIRDTLIRHSTPGEGRAEFPQVESFRSLFRLSHPNYRTLTLEDTVLAPRDSVFGQPTLREIRVKLVAIATQAQDSLWGIQARVLLRDRALNPLTSGVLTFRDSAQVERKVLDEDADGEVPLSGLRPGEQFVTIEHPGHQGRKFLVTIPERHPDSARNHSLPSFPVTLRPLSQSLSGRVFHKVPGKGALPLQGARVELEPMGDSLYFPARCTTYTLSQPDSLGVFLFDSIAELPATLYYFASADAREPSLIDTVTEREVVLSAPLAPVVLTGSGADAQLPLLEQAPPDTILATDTLLFRFNQPVDTVRSVEVKQANHAAPLLTPYSLSADKKTLRIHLQDAAWRLGFLYEYRLHLVNGVGEAFRLPASPEPLIKGFFHVEVPPAGDSTLIFPTGMRIPYHSSGTDIRFDSTLGQVSLLPDSTTNFSRLDWDWPAGDGKGVDSLLVYIRDSRSLPQWVLFRAFPAFLDSATLIWSDLYATAGFPTANSPAFPPSVGRTDTVQVRIVPKHGNEVFFERDTLLGSFTWKMGPSVYTHYLGELDSLLLSGPGSDTIRVGFSAAADDTVNLVQLDTATVVPRLLSSVPGLKMSWKWEPAGNAGLLIYTLNPGQHLQDEWMRLDVDERPHQGRPLFHRNRQQAVYFKP